MIKMISVFSVDCKSVVDPYDKNKKSQFPVFPLDKSKPFSRPGYPLEDEEYELRDTDVITPDLIPILKEKIWEAFKKVRNIYSYEHDMKEWHISFETRMIRDQLGDDEFKKLIECLKPEFKFDKDDCISESFNMTALWEPKIKHKYSQTNPPSYAKERSNTLPRIPRIERPRSYCEHKYYYDEFEGLKQEKIDKEKERKDIEDRLRKKYPKYFTQP
jgi:hypothetical protein